jgi:maltose alpha-D-glucosyltransferase / alpha-amylase
MDPGYHYSAVNVEAQLRSPTSLLNWMRRLIRVRKKYPVFGRGSLKFVPCENRRVVAYLREWRDQKVLVVNNLSAHVQPAELDLRSCRGQTPVELFGNRSFPSVGDHPYFLSLSPYSSFLFRLQDENPAVGGQGT